MGWNEKILMEQEEVLPFLKNLSKNTVLPEHIRVTTDGNKHYIYYHTSD